MAERASLFRSHLRIGRARCQTGTSLPPSLSCHWHQVGGQRPDYRRSMSEAPGQRQQQDEARRAAILRTRKRPLKGIQNRLRRPRGSSKGALWSLSLKSRYDEWCIAQIPDTDPQWPPKEPFNQWIQRHILQFWHRPITVWFRERGVIALGVFSVAFVCLSVALGSFDDSPRYMIGYTDPFLLRHIAVPNRPASIVVPFAPPSSFVAQQPPSDPLPTGLTGGPQLAAIALRILGWIAAPAMIGSIAGLLAAESLRRRHGQGLIAAGRRGSSHYMFHYREPRRDDGSWENDELLKQFYRGHGWSHREAQRCWRNIFIAASAIVPVERHHQRGRAAAGQVLLALTTFNWCPFCLKAIRQVPPGGAPQVGVKLTAHRGSGVVRPRDDQTE